MADTIKLKKGFDINLAGKAEKTIGKFSQPKTFAIKPSDFIGMERAKELVQVGDVVKAGTPLLFDKKAEGILYTSPVSGEVVEVKRGAKRALIQIVVLADAHNEYEDFKKFSVSEASTITREESIGLLKKSGIWPQIIQRPFGVVANPEDSPKSIFISAFDTHPLAPDYDFLFKGEEKYFQVGVDVLNKLTKGNVHINVDAQAEVSNVFVNARNVQINKFSGPHPTGNVGVQIHHVDPIGKEDVVWTINPYGVIQIGKLLLEGKYKASKKIALAGSEVSNPQYIETYMGANVEGFLTNNLKQDNVRVISGNILTGTAIEKNDFLGFYDHLISVIPEGDKARFFATEGWLAPTTRVSFHKAFGLFSFLQGNKEHVMDTSTNGEERAFVMTGTFEKVMPMDILPTYLFKAIMAEDYEDMEALGLFEVVEEDVALCEFVDVSKHDLQHLVRQGIELFRKG
ncbi:MAG: Na+-transporting NADH:ubiquinone oxidoreductase subunit A [Arenicella sp.]|jgi:Na+-transporting NADH:ubiquinone oxidoreductase subunit A